MVAVAELSDASGSLVDDIILTVLPTAAVALLTTVAAMDTVAEAPTPRVPIAQLTVAPNVQLPSDDVAAVAVSPAGMGSEISTA